MKILFRLNPFLQQRQREKIRWIFPIKLAMYATLLRNQGNEIVWDGEDNGSFERIISDEKDIHTPFLDLPAADRVLTDAKNKKWQSNGNFKYHPGTYIQSASSCHWGRCIFCAEKGKKNYIRSVLSVHEELKEIKALNFSEVFDDSGSFPNGEWLDTFLDLPNPGLVMGCNMRMEEHPWRRMKHWGFRMVLFGLESANQRTLDKIHKGVRVADIRHIEEAAKAGLDCHVAVMFGYPWETDADARNTLRVLHDLLKSGVAKTAQASFYSPEGTPSPVEEQRHFVDKIYDVKFSPRFWFNKIMSIKNEADFRYLVRQIKEGLRRRS